MGEVFYWALNMSISASLVGTVVVLIRRVRQIPRRAVLFMWLFPFLRLCIPISLGSRYSIMGLTSELFGRTVAVEAAREMPFNILAMNHIALVDGYSPLLYRTVMLERIFLVSSVIWLGVAVLAAALAVYGYALWCVRARRAVHLFGNVYSLSDISSPMLVGVIHPRILVPEGMTEPGELVLFHENAHMKHLDNLWRLLALAAAAVHWFNPFVWIMLRLFLSDLEYACDERVLASVGEERRREYALMLTECAARGSVFLSNLGGASIYGRIRRILDYRRVTVFSAVCILMLIIAVGVVLLTNPV